MRKSSSLEGTSEDYVLVYQLKSVHSGSNHIVKNKGIAVRIAVTRERRNLDTPKSNVPYILYLAIVQIDE